MPSIPRRSFLSYFAMTGLALAQNSKLKKESNTSRVIVVIGGTSGMGQDAVEHFARKNDRVYFCGRRENLGKKIESKLIQEGHFAKFKKTDISEQKQVKAFFEWLAKQEKEVHFFFNNAGIAQDLESAEETQLGTIQYMMDNNFYGIYYCMKEQLKYKNQKNGCIIINNLSYSIYRVKEDQAAYSASKAALRALTKSFALSCHPQKIYIHSISPYVVRTPMLERRAKHLKVDIDRLAVRVPLGRMIECAEVSEFLYDFVRSPSPALIGHDFPISGGYHERMV